MATIELCYMKGGQRICQSDTVTSLSADSAEVGSTARDSAKPDKGKVKKKADQMLERYLPDPPEGWEMTYTP
jgi:hypothetical protein